METNPYATPAANPESGHGLASSSAVSAAAVKQLAETKPWVRFMSVITFIGAGFMLLAAVAMILMGGVGAMSGNRTGAVFTGPMGFVLAAVYAILAFVYIFPGIKLWKYAGAIARLMQSGTNEDLVAALNQQRSFWKFVGILVLSIMILYVFVIIIAVIFGGLVASNLK